MKKIIITGCPRTGSTALVYLLNACRNAFITNEFATFHYDDVSFDDTIKDNFIVNECKNFTKDKHWDLQDISNYREGLDHNLNFKLFGDKRPDYCECFASMDHLINNHQDAYFIFTHRHPCAIALSCIQRSSKEPNSKASWYARDVETASNIIVRHTNNWLSAMYPNVRNKLIVNYDFFIQHPKKLVNKLELYLGTKLNIDNPKDFYAHKNPFAYKQLMSDWQKKAVNSRFNILKEKIDRVIND